VPSLFAPHVVRVVFDGVAARTGVVGAGREWFKLWRTLTGAQLSRLPVSVAGVLGPRRFLRNKPRRDPYDPLQPVVVRHMWHTGFDAPSLQPMHPDKPMRDHGPMQALVRVNRVFRDKPGGLAVDYLGLPTNANRRSPPTPGAAARGAGARPPPRQRQGAVPPGRAAPHEDAWRMQAGHAAATLTSPTPR
jgi:hypothetical protein